MNVRHKAKRFIKDHGADLFSILAGIGVIATGITAYTAGRNAKNEMDGSDERRTRARDVLVPVSVGAGTIACIGAARYCGYKKEESLLAASAVLSSYLARGKRGDLTEEDARDDNSRDFDPTDIEDTGTGEAIFIEDFTGRKFKASMEVVEYAIRKLQEDFEVCNCATLNTFYGLLGLSETSAGDMLGWSVNQSILDPYIDDLDYDSMKDGLTDLGIFIENWIGVGYVIHYPILPISGLAGIGPCNY